MAIESEIPPQALQNYRALADKIRDVRLLTEERTKAARGRFNIFRTLLQEHDEVRLHTRFLHCLLNPEGSHDCGSLFLDLFLETLSQRQPSTDDVSCGLLIPVSDAKWIVRKEASCPPHGQIDILLERLDFGIAIENKIHAGEGRNQLARYSEYLRKFGTASRTIYLTLDGKESFTHEGNPYLRISYSEDILFWLEKCLQATYHLIPINQVLLQYRDVVRNLTRYTMNRAEMKSLADFINRTPEIIRHKDQIIQAIEFARIEFVNQLASGVMQSMKDMRHKVEFRDGMKLGDFGTAAFGALIITPNDSSPLWSKGFKVWVETSRSENIYVGLKVPKGYKKSLAQEDQTMLENMNRFMDGEESDSVRRVSNPNDAWPTGWEYLFWPFDDNCLADLIEKNQQNVIAGVCQDVCRHIALLERAYAAVISSEPEAI